MKIALVILVVLVIALSVIVFACVEVVPPRTLTHSRMTAIEERIRDYAAVHHRLPDNLSELLIPAENRDHGIVDGWGRPIQYEGEGQTITLLSLGKDGRPDGNGQDADIKATFTVSER